MSYLDMGAIFNAAGEINRLEISAATRLVYLALANRRNEGTGLCNPGIDTLSCDTGLNEKSVRRAIASLRKRGLIETRYKDGKVVTEGGTGDGFRYTLRIPTADKMSGVNETECPDDRGHLVPQPRTFSPKSADRMSYKPGSNREKNLEGEPGRSSPALSCKEMAKKIMSDLEISNTFAEEKLVDVCGFAIKRFPDKTEDQICAILVESRKEYEQASAKGKLDRLWKHESFFGEGLWKDKQLWNWKPEHKPAPPLTTIKLDELEWRRHDEMQASAIAASLQSRGSSATRVERTLAASREAAARRRGPGVASPATARVASGVDAFRRAAAELAGC